MTPRPIEIIGGGLAGLSLGLALRREGIPVTVQEAGDYPRHRVCGEFIAGLGASTIARLGIASAVRGALEHKEVAWSMAGGSAVVQQLPSAALGISRHALDSDLAGRFVAAGGILHTHARSTDAVNLPGRVFASGRQRAAEPRWIGLKVHALELPLVRNLEMHLGGQSYVGLCRVAEGINVCGLFRRRAIQGHGVSLLVGYLRAVGLDLLADRLAAAPIDPASFCAVAGLDFDRPITHRDGVSLGDAAAAIPPFTGNGMAMAFQSAELALGPLTAFARGTSTWAETSAAIATALRRRFRLRLASARALHSFLLHPRRQRWFSVLGRARLLPFKSLYATLH